MSQVQPLDIVQYIEKAKLSYSIEKGHQAGGEYAQIIAPFVKHIDEQRNKIRELEDKLSNKKKNSIIEKGKKDA